MLAGRRDLTLRATGRVQFACFGGARIFRSSSRQRKEGVTVSVGAGLFDQAQELQQLDILHQKASVLDCEFATFREQDAPRNIVPQEMAELDLG